MPSIPLGFASPFVLAALVGLPLLYLLLRVTPPSPERVPFPPLRLILALRPKEETAARTPLWLVALRIAIAAALIVATAGPVLEPLPEALAGTGPLLIVLDDGWPTAPSFEERRTAAGRALEAATRASRPGALLPLSQASRGIPLDAPDKVLTRLRALKPVPFLPDRLAAAEAIEKFAAVHPKPAILWIADGLDSPQTRQFAERLKAVAGAVILETDASPIRALAGARNETGSLKLRVLRPLLSGPGNGTVRALDRKGLAIGEAAFDFAGRAETEASFELPAELRNDIARLEIAGERSAGAVFLLDERSHRRRIGIISGENADLAQPLLAPDYYLKKALLPFADVLEAGPSAAEPIGTLLDEKASIMILADAGVPAGEAHDRLARFVEDGGILVRFAGSHLAGTFDDLLPVRLRLGGRVLGGAMSWDTPKKLAPFERQSPFFGLNVPDEVTVSRQVLAEPSPGLPARTWASLADGTPLVTASRQGKGLIVLFHVSADTNWSNLPISGLFVGMLRKIVDLSVASQGGAGDVPQAEAKTSKASLAPRQTLDGFGVLGAPPPDAKPIPAGFAGTAEPQHPPGFYGSPEAPAAVNVLASNDTLAAADFSGFGFRAERLSKEQPIDLAPWLLALAFVLLAADTLVSLWLSGALRFARGAAVLLAGLAVAMPAEAQAGEARGPDRDLAAALTTRLAYVATGDARTDEVTRDGLLSLSHELARRTSLTPGEPVAVDPARDELSFYPLIYWPIAPAEPQPSREAAAKAARFMKQGGTIVFDTRDAPLQREGAPSTPQGKWLRTFLEGIDVPALEPIPADHVVTKTFYLLDGFLGRYTTGTTWIEALPPPPADGSPRPARAGDGVSPILITANDLAAGWASGPSGESLFPLMPGGERQHELALRGGINLVMYTLTGNYKSDQVHVRDLLERLAH